MCTFLSPPTCLTTTDANRASHCSILYPFRRRESQTFSVYKHPFLIVSDSYQIPHLPDTLSPLITCMDNIWKVEMSRKGIREWWLSWFISIFIKFLVIDADVICNSSSRQVKRMKRKGEKRTEIVGYSSCQKWQIKTSREHHREQHNFLHFKCSLLSFLVRCSWWSFFSPNMSIREIGSPQ